MACRLSNSSTQPLIAWSIRILHNCKRQWNTWQFCLRSTSVCMSNMFKTMKESMAKAAPRICKQLFDTSVSLKSDDSDKTTGHDRPRSQALYASSFWSLAVCKNGERRPGEFHHVIHGTADITDSRYNSLFTFVSTVTEKLENRNKFQRRGKSYL